jgi:hypothetical protein
MSVPGNAWTVVEICPAQFFPAFSWAGTLYNLDGLAMALYLKCINAKSLTMLGII